MLETSVEPLIDRSLRQDSVFERAPRDYLSCIGGALSSGWKIGSVSLGHIEPRSVAVLSALETASTSGQFRALYMICKRPINGRR